MSFQYRSVENEYTGLYKDKSSKFIAYLFPIQNQEEFANRLAALKKEHPQARHFCYAYRLGFPKDVSKSSDDGEPAGTAGKPILNQLLSEDLRNVAIIVVRYFGGTLLGSSGLIKAYKGASADALMKAHIIQVEPRVQLTIETDYLQLNSILQYLKAESIKILNKTVDDTCCIEIEIPISKYDGCIQKLESDNLKYVFINKE